MNQTHHLFNFDSAALPHINIVSTCFTPSSKLAFKESNVGNIPLQRLTEVVIAFSVEGQIESYYEGFKEPITSTSHTSTFLYTPFDNQHCIPAGQRFDSFILGIEINFFHALLNDAQSPWMEKLIRNMEKQIPFSVVHPTLPISNPNQVLIQQIRAQQPFNNLRKLYLQSKVSELLFSYFNEIENRSTPTQLNGIKPADVDKLYGLKQYLEHSFLEEHSLEGLARQCGLNLFKLKQGFKAVHGTSVFDFIRQRRMEHAAALLRDTSLNVGEVALQVGYSHLNHFSAAFKKHFGLSPKHWK